MVFYGLCCAVPRENKICRLKQLFAYSPYQRVKTFSGRAKQNALCHMHDETDGSTSVRQVSYKSATVTYVYTCTRDR